VSVFGLTIEHQIDIAASPERVYDVLTRTTEWPEWSTMLQFRGGVLALGESVRLGLRTETASYDFTARITALEPGRAFEWLARTGLPGLFDGRHRFELSPLGTTGCRLRNVEWYTGLLVPVVSRTATMRAAPAGFASMNEQIRRRAEDVRVTA
jgi:hypothetical protein